MTSCKPDLRVTAARDFDFGGSLVGGAQANRGGSPEEFARVLGRDLAEVARSWTSEVRRAWLAAGFFVQRR